MPSRLSLCVRVFTRVCFFAIFPIVPHPLPYDDDSWFDTIPVTGARRHTDARPARRRRTTRPDLPRVARVARAAAATEDKNLSHERKNAHRRTPLESNRRARASPGFLRPNAGPDRAEGVAKALVRAPLLRRIQGRGRLRRRPLLGHDHCARAVRGRRGAERVRPAVPRAAGVAQHGLGRGPASPLRRVCAVGSGERGRTRRGYRQRAFWRRTRSTPMRGSAEARRRAGGRVRSRARVPARLWSGKHDRRSGCRR